MKDRRKRRGFTDEFKGSIVKLYNNGKSRSSLIREYDLTPSTLASWIRKYNNTGSLDVNVNRSEEEKELIKLKKDIQQLRMENDILKQAALILGQNKSNKSQ